jgi:hypothetical protein
MPDAPFAMSLTVFEIVSPLPLIPSNQHANWISWFKDFEVNTSKYCIIYCSLDFDMRKKIVIVGRTFLQQEF